METKNNTRLTNSGDWNSGDRNSGYGNSGYWNSGDRNSGYGNSCNRSSGVFCTLSPQLQIFNKPTDKKWEEIEHPSFREFYLDKWISESEMSAQEKTDFPDFDAREGYLKTYAWEEAWANYWRNSDEKEKQRVLNLPNFDAAIFKEITGICIGREEKKFIVIEGRKYKLVEIEE